MQSIQELPLVHLIVLCAFVTVCFYLLMDYLKKVEDKKYDTDSNEQDLIKIIKVIDHSAIYNEASKCQLIEVAIRCFSEKDDGDGTDLSND